MGHSSSPTTTLLNAMQGVGHGHLGFAALGHHHSGRSRLGTPGPGRNPQGPTDKLVSPSIPEKAKLGLGWVGSCSQPLTAHSDGSVQGGPAETG